MITQSVGGISFRLREEHDLRLIENYGNVFKIYDQHTCGMLSFGLINQSGQRIYLKYAGARTICYPSEPGPVVEKLRRAMIYYQSLRHAALIKYIDGVDLGYACFCVFEWAEGLPLGPEPEGYKAFRLIPLHQRLLFYDMICDFHQKAENAGLAIAGLGDSHFNFHPQNLQLLLTNIDNYLPFPGINTRGRLPGSPIYMPPEGYQIGSAIDETSNVYTLAALSHSFFGNKFTKKNEAWEASDLLFEVARKGLQEDRNNRPQSTQEYLSLWREGVMRSKFS